MSRRGTSLVIANMLLNTATSTKIGTALRAMDSGVTISSSSLKRSSTNDIATPRTAPAISPTSAFEPDTRMADQTRSTLSTNRSRMADGGTRK